jgi:thiosulfate/3-mercaptopyruvate sulfurtransferase
MASGAPLHIVDGSLFPGEDCKAKFEEAHIPGAVYFDQDSIRNKNSAHSLGLLSPAAFADHMKTLNLPNDGSLIVVYDQYGLISGARVWFLLRYYYGYQFVSFLDGGFPKWTQERRPVTTGPNPDPPEAKAAFYQLASHLEYVTHVEEVKSIVAELKAGERNKQIWDPRNPAKVTGSLIPGSTCIFYRDLLDVDGTFRPAQEMAEILTKQGLDLNRPVVVSCNRGVVSCAAYLILTLLGKTDVKNYMGSWIDWKAKVVDVETQVVQ